MVGQNLAVHALEIKALTARQHRHRHFSDFGGGEDELHMLGRFLERFQKRVEGRGGQHVHLVNDVDLVARADGRIAHPVENLADIRDAGAGRGVHLHHVHMGGARNGVAMPARRGESDGGLVDGVGVVIERAGDQARRGGFAHPAHPGHHIGVGDPARRERIGQRAHHRLLADQVVKGLRAVFARQHLIAGIILGRLGLKTGQGRAVISLCRF